MLYENLCLFITLTYLSQFLLCHIQFHVADIAGFLSTGVDAFHTGNTFFLISFFRIFHGNSTGRTGFSACLTFRTKIYICFWNERNCSIFFIRIVPWNLNINIIKIYSVAKFTVQLDSEKNKIVAFEMQICFFSL